MADQQVQSKRLFYRSPLGWLRIEAATRGVTKILFCDTREAEDLPDPVTRETEKQLMEYFAGNRRDFQLTLDMAGTDFQLTVWKALIHIPFGRTQSYLELAQRIGNVKAIRAVGHANGVNPLPIVIPCHRVIGSDGSLTGYGGGLWRKKWLLQHEGVLPPELPF